MAPFVLSTYDHEEFDGLVPGPEDRMEIEAAEANVTRRKGFPWRFIGVITLCFTLSMGISYFVYSMASSDNGATTKAKLQQSAPSLTEFLCPQEIHKAENFDDKSFEEVYTNVTRDIEQDVPAFLAHFREAEFDGWGKSYQEVKAGLHDWKVANYPRYIADGSKIYESACGIGLNLIMTLETILEVKNVKNVELHGNEYIPESAETANKILDAMAPQLNATRGTVCAGDSTDLHFVPSNYFDLVFTGYISTLLDPLNLNLGDIDENYEEYKDLCTRRRSDWEAKKLVEIAQERQNDWFGLWVSEMVRIAKPGAPVIIEEVSLPYCKDPRDWGGVSRGFWKRAIDKYSWDIDPETIAMMDDSVFPMRYHVSMRKNGP